MPKCNICSLNLTSIKALTIHIFLKHSNAENQYDCGEIGCNSRFDILNSLQNHLRLVHKFPSQPLSTDGINNSTLTEN